MSTLKPLPPGSELTVIYVILREYGGKSIFPFPSYTVERFSHDLDTANDHAHAHAKAQLEGRPGRVIKLHGSGELFHSYLVCPDDAAALIVKVWVVRVERCSED